jgi:hypothetical protein
VFTKDGVLTGAAVIGSWTTLTYTPAQAASPGDTPVVTWEWYVTYPGGTPEPIAFLQNRGQVTFLNENGKWTDGVITVVATATNKTGTATNTSNVIGPLLGTPRMLTDGLLYLTSGAVADRYLNLSPGTFYNPTTVSWEAGVEGTSIGFSNPTTQIRLRSEASNKQAIGSVTASNAYGDTRVFLDPVDIPVVS